MNSRFAIFSILILCLSLMSFTDSNEIRKCYFLFTTPTGFNAQEPDRLPEDSKKSRELKTTEGIKEITCIDGYRVLYKNAKNAAFVNMKVELSEKKAFADDQKKILENIDYLISTATILENKELVKLEVNGFTLYGFSRSSIEGGTNLGTFVMFPEKGVSVYFYFNNLNPTYRNYESIEEYIIQRNQFLNEYTQFLKSCDHK